MDILRTNKIFRDISRPLGTEWRPVFDRLMAQFPQDVVTAERVVIEKDRPFLQAYKSLMTWKEACGSDFNIQDLVDALQITGHDDLASRVLEISNSEFFFCFSWQVWS